MLDWFKRAGQEPQDWMWQQYKHAPARGPQPARPEPLSLMAKEARAPPAVVTPPATHPIVEATLGGARAAVPYRLSPDCAENLWSC